MSDLEPLRDALFALFDGLPLVDRVSVLNDVRRVVCEFSPFAAEPVDHVEWVPMTDVEGNTYNPNAVAPPEMELLRHSIQSDGYTQPIVTNRENNVCVVVDGFHRNRVGREFPEITARLHGYLPVVQIRTEQSGHADRVASTIRHNRARGKHQVLKMSDIVLDLKRRNWSDAKIGRELGMDPDEVLRLTQITGLAEAFRDRQFSEAWEAIIDGAEDDVSEIVEQAIGADDA